MSSYIKEAKNPKTGKVVKAFFIDDFYGQNIYSVAFRKDGTDAVWSGEKMGECDFYKEEELKSLTD